MPSEKRLKERENEDFPPFSLKTKIKHFQHRGTLTSRADGGRKRGNGGVKKEEEGGGERRGQGQQRRGKDMK